MRNRTLLIALISTATLFGCKKKDDGGADKADKTDKADKPADMSGAKPDKPADKAAGGIASTDEYKAKSTALNAKTIEVFKEPDCDKLAAGMVSMLDANKADIDATNAWEKAHPDDKKAFEDATAKDMMAATAPAMEKCKDNAAFKAAAAKMDAAGG